MNLPAYAEFPDRPSGPEAHAHIGASFDIAARYFRACCPGPEVGDGLASPPILHYGPLHGVLALEGVMLACDGGKPFASINPWGQWLFVASGGEARNVETFLGDPFFMADLELGEPWSPGGVPRIQLFPVLRTFGISLPVPRLYRYVGTNHPKEHAARVGEWQRLINDPASMPPKSLQLRRVAV